MTLRDTPPAYAYVASAMTRHITPACQRHVAIISLLRHYAIYAIAIFHCRFSLLFTLLPFSLSFSTLYY
jgi:hypothetical protein